MNSSCTLPGIRDSAVCMEKNEFTDLSVEQGDGWIVIDVRVQPRSSSNGVTGIMNGALKVRITAPPADGKANKALQAFLAKRLGIAKGDVEIVKGRSSRDKRVRLTGISMDDLPTDW